MGGILSNEERAARARGARRKSSQHPHRHPDITLGVPWDAHGYRYREQSPGHHQNQKRSHRKRSEEKHIGDREERNPNTTRARSHSLDAILEEFYLSETEGDNLRPIIPRAKLNTISRGVDAKLYARQGLSRFQTDSASLHAIHMQVERKALERSCHYLRPSLSLPFLDQSDWVEDSEEPASMGPPSFSQDFDACMKQLEDLQRNKEIREVSTLPKTKLLEPETHPESEGDSKSPVAAPRARCVKRQQTPTSDSSVPPPEVTTSDATDSDETADDPEVAEEACEEPEIRPVVDKCTEKILIVEPEEIAKDQESETYKPRGWYCNIKEQFERLDRELGGSVGRQDGGCRITGATLKHPAHDMQHETDTVTKRKHYFSQLVRSNKSLIDEELPDPDKVQNIRAMFQEQHRGLGGSLQNISTARLEAKPERPKSALGSRKEDEMRCLTPDSVDTDTHTQPYKTGYTKEQPPGRRARLGHNHYRRWTDTGSMSSGVSSDLSSCETDHESYTRDHTEPVSSDDEIDVVGKHYIQSEILEKIRSFGTSVTYFGGEMIRCSVGPLVSPTTHAILEEIGQKQPNGLPSTRSFDEFYKKYKESTKKRKVGRTRSFAQEEMFQKSNVFTDSEIDEHKTELENAFGIRRPKGNLPVGTKNKLGKSYSLDSRIQALGKAIEIQERLFSRVENEIKPRAEIVVEKKATGATARPHTTTNQFFDYSVRRQIPKVDMEFEEFQVLENISDRTANKSAAKDNVSERTEDTPEVTAKEANDEPIDNGMNAADTEKVENKSIGFRESHSLFEQKPAENESTERNNRITVNQDQEEEKSGKRNSIQDKLTSWEEAIQQKRLSTESRLNERKDGTELLLKRTSKDSTDSQRSASTEELINNFEDHIRRRSGDNGDRPASNCSSESTHSIDFESVSVAENVSKDAGNTDTWGRQAQLRRNSLETQNKRNSCNDGEKELSGEFNGSGTWKRFLASRRFSSTESLAQSRHCSQDTPAGSRRNSVKKLAPLEHNGLELCQETRRHSLDRLSRKNGVSVPTQEKRSKAAGNDNDAKSTEENSRKSSIGKKENEKEKFSQLVKDGKSRSQAELRGSGSAQVRADITNASSVRQEIKPDRQVGLSNIKANQEMDKTTNEQADHKITIRISQTEKETYKIGNDEFEEIVLNDDPVDSLEFYIPKSEGEAKSKPSQSLPDQKEKEKTKGEHSVVTEYKRRFDKNKNYKGPSRWPVETTVVVDMEKTDEIASKIISNSKTLVKSKKRVF